MIDVNTNPSRRELNAFAVLLPAFAALLGVILRLRFGAPVAANAVWIAGAAVTVMFLAAPPLRPAIYVAWMYLTWPIAWLVSHVLLAITYYLVLTPIGLFMRFAGRDPMRRHFEPDAPTYWTEHDPHGDVDRYYRQF